MSFERCRHAPVSAGNASVIGGTLATMTSKRDRVKSKNTEEATADALQCQSRASGNR